MTNPSIDDAVLGEFYRLVSLNSRAEGAFLRAPEDFYKAFAPLRGEYEAYVQPVITPAFKGYATIARQLGLYEDFASLARVQERRFRRASPDSTP